MSADDEGTPYAGPGDETTPRRDAPEDAGDVKEYVELVGDEVPEEHLADRVEETFDDEGGAASGRSSG